jgi:hypothetical protein
MQQQIHGIQSFLEANYQQGDVAALREEIKYLHSNLERLDRKSREENIIIYNLPGPGSAEQVKSLFPAVVAGSISSVRRLGRPTEGKKLPVLVKFSSLQAKHEAFKSSKTLRARSIFLDDDLTLEQRKTRQGLRPAFAQLKEQGLRPFWRGERLLYVTNEGVRKYAPPNSAPSSAPPPAPQA